jgi:uncharacterized peroxidase-related enzyme
MPSIDPAPPEEPFLPLGGSPDQANYERAFARHPHVFQAWQTLLAALKQGVDPRRYELATFAAARRLRSSYCCLAHGQVLAEEHLDPAKVRAIAIDYHEAGLAEVEVAIMDFATKVAGDASSVTRADVDRLRALGLSEKEVFDFALAAAARAFLTKTLDAVGVLPDASFRAMADELRDALTVGRAIAEEP